MKAVFPAAARPLIEAHLPPDLETAWFSTRAEAVAAMPGAEIAWLDFALEGVVEEAVAVGTSLRWLFTAQAGLDKLDLAQLAARGTTVTNGTGINAIACAEYTLMGILVAAKRYDDVVRAADRREWLTVSPGRVELFESRALVIGMGAIGSLIAERLRGFGVDVAGVTRSGRDGTLTPDAWPARLGEFDWVILAAPSTDATKAMIGAEQLAAMKPSAWLINIARGDMIDQDALIAALRARRIAGAFLDATDPEPLPAEHPLWSAPNALITTHLSGRSSPRLVERALALFLHNLRAYFAGAPMKNVFDLNAGY